mmetsp:Transcript_44309/g.105481  ORF Transcript_44309/g.105481 Transcript_44309/m.105481 type:complete len:207 (+) Transcript_44309:11280-11900(+)
MPGNDEGIQDLAKVLEGHSDCRDKSLNHHIVHKVHIGLPSRCCFGDLQRLAGILHEAVDLLASICHIHQSYSDTSLVVLLKLLHGDRLCSALSLQHGLFAPLREDVGNPAQVALHDVHDSRHVADHFHGSSNEVRDMIFPGPFQLCQARGQYRVHLQNSVFEKRFLYGKQVCQHRVIEPHYMIQLAGPGPVGVHHRVDGQGFPRHL